MKMTELESFPLPEDIDNAAEILAVGFQYLIEKSVMDEIYGEARRQELHNKATRVATEIISKAKGMTNARNTL
jgi:hypothetical protein